MSRDTQQQLYKALGRPVLDSLTPKSLAQARKELAAIKRRRFASAFFTTLAVCVLALACGVELGPLLNGGPQ